MAIFNSYVKLPEGIWLSYWCVLRREWMVGNGVAGIMTLLVMKWIIPENSLRLAPVSINPFFWEVMRCVPRWIIFWAPLYRFGLQKPLRWRRKWWEATLPELTLFWGQVEGKCAGSSIIRWFWMGKASMKDCWYTHTHIYIYIIIYIYTYGLHMGSFWFLLLSVLLKQLYVTYIYIEYLAEAWWNLWCPLLLGFTWRSHR